MHLGQFSTWTYAQGGKPCNAQRYVAGCIRRSTHHGHDSSKLCAWSGTTNTSPLSTTDGEMVGRQTYIQESMNFTGAELAARLDSMQARLRAQRAPAATVPSPAAGGSRVAAATTPASVRTASHAATSAAYTVPVPPAVDATPASTDSSSDSQLSGTQAATPSTSSDTTMNGSSGTYSNSTLQGLSATEKLRALQQVQQVSRQALQQVSTPVSPYYVNAPKTIDIRMYDQLVNAHNKLSKKLGESNAHIEVLQEQVDRCHEDLMAAFELLKQIAMEFGTTSRLAASTAAAVQFGVDPQDALDKIGKLQERLSTLEQAVLEQRQEFGLRVVRKVPVEWVGVASEVRIMGDFDGWTRGHELSAEDVTSDSVFSRFESTLMLRPGSYRVKFLVDNEWRQAADWPTEVDLEGNTVNVLTVT